MKRRTLLSIHCLGAATAFIVAAYTSACGDAASSSTSATSTGSSSAGGGQGGSMAGAGGAQNTGGAGGEASDPDVVPTSTAPRGAEATAELCSNGKDDDGNGYADCDDTWCRQTTELTICDALENTAKKCGDNADNVESPKIPGQTYLDTLIDCDDPDCAKNPVLSVCPAHLFELGAAACSNGDDDDGDGLTDCADLDCLHAGASACPLGAKRRVLFDDAHRERAGNGDWVVDMPGRHPWPSTPKTELEWAGQLSSLGKDLVDNGYTVETLTSATGYMTFKDAANAADLSNYDVVVVPEPSAPLDAEESAALLAYINAGGGVLMVTDHFDSDRDGNGWDSVQVWNDFLTKAGGGSLDKNPLGFSVTEISYNESGVIEAKNGSATSVIGDAAHPVIAGANGAVTKIGMHKGGLFTLYPGQNATLSVLIHALPLGTVGYEAGSPYVVAASVGAGRVVAIGDSAIMNDGTNSHGASIPGFDSYHEPTEQNAALLRNAIDWLSAAGAP